MSAKLIRAWLNLKEQEDGATEQQIADALGITRPDVESSLRRMPDCFIDRWESSTARAWIAVRIPPHCPKPDRWAKPPFRGGTENRVSAGSEQVN